MDVPHPLWPLRISHPLLLMVADVLHQSDAMGWVPGAAWYDRLLGAGRFATIGKNASAEKQTSPQLLYLGIIAVLYRQAAAFRYRSVVGSAKMKIAQAVCSRWQDVSNGNDDCRLSDDCRRFILTR